jgi:hypothetical protein
MLGRGKIKASKDGITVPEDCFLAKVAKPTSLSAPHRLNRTEPGFARRSWPESRETRLP